MWGSAYLRTAAIAGALVLGGCGSSGTKTVTVTTPAANTSASSAPTSAALSQSTATTTSVALSGVSAGDAKALLVQLQTEWDNDDQGQGIDGLLTYNAVYDYQTSGFSPIRGFNKVMKHILGLLNSNGKDNSLRLTGVQIGSDGIGTYATGTWVSANVKGNTGTFQIRFSTPSPSPFKNDPCATMPCIQQITLVPTPAPVQG